MRKGRLSVLGYNWVNSAGVPLNVTAVQITDRFHLVSNLSEAAERDIQQLQIDARKQLGESESRDSKKVNKLTLIEARRQRCRQARVPVQREMERERSPLASIPPFQGGDFRGIRGLPIRCMLGRARKANFRAPKHRLDEPHQAIPRHGCIPAEPASVSPGKVIVAPLGYAAFCRRRCLSWRACSSLRSRAA